MGSAASKADAGASPKGGQVKRDSLDDGTVGFAKIAALDPAVLVRCS